MRTPHNATVMRNIGTKAVPIWEWFQLEGVKIDDVTGRVAARLGYDRDDTMRMLVYLDFVEASREDWDIPVGSYFTDSLCTPPATPGLWKKEKPDRVWQVTSTRTRTNTAPVLYHLEISGR
jgi:hypothetical protein